MPHPCWGPSVSRVRNTMKAREPCSTSVFSFAMVCPFGSLQEYTTVSCWESTGSAGTWRSRPAPPRDECINLWRGQAQAGQTQGLGSVPGHVDNAYRPASDPGCRRFEDHGYCTSSSGCEARGTVVGLTEVTAGNDAANRYGFSSGVPYSRTPRRAGDAHRLTGERQTRRRQSDGRVNTGERKYQGRRPDGAVIEAQCLDFGHQASAESGRWVHQEEGRGVCAGGPKSLSIQSCAAIPFPWGSAEEARFTTTPGASLDYAWRTTPV